MSINGTIGNLAYYNDETVMLGKSSAYINLQTGINKDFIYYSLQSERIVNYFYSELTGTTIKNLSLKTIKETPIPLPSSAEQSKIAYILSSIDSNIETKEQKLSKLKDQKKALMNDLLTGKVRV